MADLSSEPERNHAAAEDDDDHDNDGILHDAGTVKTDNANAADRIVEILEEEREEARHAEPPTPIGNGVAAQRYHKLMLDARNDTASDDGSIDGGLPRRAGSPIDSLLSVPDDSPSAQVRMHRLSPSGALTLVNVDHTDNLLTGKTAGLCHLLPQQQQPPPLHSLPPRSWQPDALFSSL